MNLLKLILHEVGGALYWVLPLIPGSGCVGLGWCPNQHSAPRTPGSTQLLSYIGAFPVLPFQYMHVEKSKELCAAEVSTDKPPRPDRADCREVAMS